MEYIRETIDFKVANDTAITLGKFDGLHKGHELLIENLIKISNEKNLKSVAFTFDIPPVKLVKEDKLSQNKVITTNDEKHYIFEKTGLDYLIECPFRKEIMMMSPIDFIKWMVKSLNVKYFIVGEDFKFGYKRQGDYITLKEYSKQFGYKVLVITKIKDEQRDISSTYIREELLSGNIRKANSLLGYEFFVKSKVIQGNKIGRTIGIPTINMILPPNKILPPNGVYVTSVNVDEKWYRGVTNVGCKPTISDNNPIGIETYIIDFCQDIYGKEVYVSFLDFIREERKFNSIEELKHQMISDIEIAKKW
ncbi:bifunctional riboflavin kinase/FAD synthetase [Lachnobacterium bovis]|uniref:bifunctional riboflavin kinase/FAD synthetase n=1 Tax=Lachnobacterium bovis TaxID=140626 RepID=UPI00048ECA9D|nr:bifunctional riboflavin kinase/FAD synthetase [Lachnobacterium bovis]